MKTKVDKKNFLAVNCPRAKKQSFLIHFLDPKSRRFLNRLNWLTKQLEIQQLNLRGSRCWLLNNLC